MSRKERKRLVVLAEVKSKKLTVTPAAGILGLSYQQTKRVWQRYRKLGEASLVHRARGQPGGRRKAAPVRARILARYRERYADFGPNLAVEYLGQEGLAVNHETLRRWLLEAGLRGESIVDVNWRRGRDTVSKNVWLGLAQAGLISRPNLAVFGC